LNPGVRCQRGTLPSPDRSIHKTGWDVEGTRGAKQLALLEHYGLRPTSDVLEIGCGIGRLAYELASFLTLDAQYRGFDIAPRAIAWLKENYEPRLTGFEFHLLSDVQNPRYHESGSVASETVRFPYPDASFDLVCAFEVLMHLPLEGVRNYLDEVARVLRPGGVAVLTFMAIWDNEIEPVFVGRPFVAIGGGVHTRFPEKRGVSMGYRAGLIRGLFRAVDLQPIGELEGLWHSPHKPRPPGPVHNCDVFAVRRPEST
jgi:SAM-dependent methyltransferase